MKYLTAEKVVFQLVAKQFDEEYHAAVAAMVGVYERKAEGREESWGVPIHHHSGPGDMVREVQVKARRVKGRLSDTNWWSDPRALEAIREECLDGANYALFLAALCNMRLKEAPE